MEANTVTEEAEVVVVGAGPTGLWLAAELRLQGVRVTVLEARTEPSPHSKALTVHPRTVEILGMRGLTEVVEAGAPLPFGHFGALESRLDFRGLDTPYPFTLLLPQARTEALLEAHARERGAVVRRGHRVTALEQDPGSVRLSVDGPEGPYEIEARYAVGCDGTRSTVRKAAGIAFPGTDATVWGWLADVVLDAPPAGGPVSRFGAAGGVMAVPLPDGLTRFVGIDPQDHRPGDSRPEATEPTLDEVRASTVRVLGSDFGMREPRWISRFGNATRQAATYRAGRILLAGDAAHMHFPTGGVGLNVGFQDATNLGWKLAATLHGTAPEGLLDSYHRERHPVGARLLASTRAQTALMTAHTAEGQALRAHLSELIDQVPEFSRALAERLGALDVRYPPADPAAAHPLTGTRAPDVAFADGTSLFALLREGRHVLLELGSDAKTLTAAGRNALPHGTLRHTTRLAEPAGRWSDLGAVLLRPDGHIADAA
ncbi:FAD-dependent oxidoreductase [Streptomyces sp. NPDC060184]|uniref:FAD-dependent oxidoreductase n=1 Tax=Streptomyces sp. NPDC060184 TaxID=3347064 RepID=UPI0036691514